MAIAKLDPMPRNDFDHKVVPWQKRHADGKDLRRTVPRESHAEWIPSKDRPDPLKLIAENNKGRQKDLIPLRMGRMGVMARSRHLPFGTVCLAMVSTRLCRIARTLSGYIQSGTRMAA